MYDVVYQLNLELYDVVYQLNLELYDVVDQLNLELYFTSERFDLTSERFDLIFDLDHVDRQSLKSRIDCPDPSLK